MKMKLPLVLGLSGLLVLGACAETSSGYGGGTLGTPGQRTQQGALAGAAVGALYGATRDSDSNSQGRDAIRGAIVGAAAGALAGNILDRQTQDLRQSVSTPGVNVVNRGSYIQVALPEGVLFATDSATVSGRAQNDLYAVARNLQAYPDSRVQVVGHTDNTGSAAYNQDLSERRARAVSSIIASGGVSPYRLSTSGRGFSEPVATNETAAGRAQNRRVEILIVPNR